MLKKVVRQKACASQQEEVVFYLLMLGASSKPAALCMAAITQSLKLAEAYLPALRSRVPGLSFCKKAASTMPRVASVRGVRTTTMSAEGSKPSNPAQHGAYTMRASGHHPVCSKS